MYIHVQQSDSLAHAMTLRSCHKVGAVIHQRGVLTVSFGYLPLVCNINISHRQQKRLCSVCILQCKQTYTGVATHQTQERGAASLHGECDH